MAGGEEEWAESAVAVAIASIADLNVADTSIADVDVVAIASYIVKDAALSAVISSLSDPSSIVAACGHEHACL